MNTEVCDVPECTYSQTLTCIKSYPPDECPSRKSAFARLAASEESSGSAAIIVEPMPAVESQVTSLVGDAVLAPPEQKPSLPRSGTLDLAEANAIMSSRYVNLVGIIGLPDAGKTACAASLYLLLAHNALKGFSYLRSKTLMALEEISRGSRRWNDGNAPTNMTTHTELPDDRQAGFLHLRLRRNIDGKSFDLLMPDLPGEWSRALINQGDDGRFGFLKAADVIWLMANGRDFITLKTREHAIYQLSNLIERLQSLVDRPRIILVTSWHDKGKIPDEVLARVLEEGKRFGFDIEFSPIASFSDTDISPGEGVAELIEKTITVKRSPSELWPAGNSRPAERAFLNFGQNQ
jgi:hypothetical protein